MTEPGPDEERRSVAQEYAHALVRVARLAFRLVTGQVEFKSPKLGDACDVAEIHAGTKFAEQTCDITGSLKALRAHEARVRSEETGEDGPAVTIDREGLEQRWEIYVDQPPSRRWGRFKLKARTRAGRRRRTRAAMRGWAQARGAPA